MEKPAERTGQPKWKEVHKKPDELLEDAETRQRTYSSHLEEIQGVLADYIRFVEDNNLQENIIHAPIYAELANMLQTDLMDRVAAHFAGYRQFFRSNTQLYFGASSAELLTGELRPVLHSIEDHLTFLDTRREELEADTTKAALLAEHDTWFGQCRDAVGALADLDDMFRRSGTALMEYILAKRENKSKMSGVCISMVFFLGAMAIGLAVLYLSNTE
ncbi:hypothetical protein J8273_4118 [Carpediemonas membranifera]|uniref:Uncharacterized protein n=1 Tax=Carpediemonas membranifera TaxID=201153 RepID=A0A8J6AUF9_9EUKA|nr:hypothetical protein J8273_4118 [Carpediemonas membranifera]|eukprot:KAG9394453.1 hypothetical protein J8273_4118 [Carpediemonas membranifera]